MEPTGSLARMVFHFQVTARCPQIMCTQLHNKDTHSANPGQSGPLLPGQENLSWNKWSINIFEVLSRSHFDTLHYQNDKIWTSDSFPLFSVTVNMLQFFMYFFRWTYEIRKKKKKLFHSEKENLAASRVTIRHRPNVKQTFSLAHTTRDDGENASFWS